MLVWASKIAKNFSILKTPLSSGVFCL